MNLAAIREIAKREVITRARTNTWKAVTTLLLLLLVGGTLVAALLDGDDDDDRRDVTIGVVGEIPDGLEALLDDPVRSRLDVTWERVEAGADLAESLDDVDVVLGPDALTWEGATDLELDVALRGALQELAVLERAEAAGLEPGELGELLAPADVSEDIIDEDDPVDDARVGLGFATAILTFLGIQVYGSLVVLGVVEEKANRVVEILLSQVSARDLLAGKVIGIGLLAFIQMAMLLTAGFIALLVVDVVDFPRTVLWIIPLLAATFVLGFLFYAVMFALAGSLVSRQEDAQQVMLPLLVPLLAGYIIGANAATSPDGAVARIASLVPFTSPFVLPPRMAAGTVEVWEVVVSLGLLAGATVLAAVVAGRVYEFTLLRVGSRVSVREVLQLARQERQTTGSG